MLRHAHLERANLTITHVEGADLTDAWLANINLQGATADENTSWPEFWGDRAKAEARGVRYQD